jgi:hypothetical protein
LRGGRASGREQPQAAAAFLQWVASESVDSLLAGRIRHMGFFGIALLYRNSFQIILQIG